MPNSARTLVLKDFNEWMHRRITFMLAALEDKQASSQKEAESPIDDFQIIDSPQASSLPPPNPSIKRPPFVIKLFHKIERLRKVKYIPDRVVTLLLSIPHSLKNIEINLINHPEEEGLANVLSEINFLKNTLKSIVNFPLPSPLLNRVKNTIKKSKLFNLTDNTLQGEFDTFFKAILLWLNHFANDEGETLSVWVREFYLFKLSLASFDFTTENLEQFMKKIETLYGVWLAIVNQKIGEKSLVEILIEHQNVFSRSSYEPWVKFVIEHNHAESFAYEFYPLLKKFSDILTNLDDTTTDALYCLSVDYDSLTELLHGFFNSDRLDPFKKILIDLLGFNDLAHFNETYLEQFSLPILYNSIQSRYLNQINITLLKLNIHDASLKQYLAQELTIQKNKKTLYKAQLILSLLNNLSEISFDEYLNCTFNLNDFFERLNEVSDSLAFKQSFEAQFLPLILGELFDAFVMHLRAQPQTKAQEAFIAYLARLKPELTKDNVEPLRKHWIKLFLALSQYPNLDPETVLSAHSQLEKSLQQSALIKEALFLPLLPLLHTLTAKIETFELRENFLKKLITTMRELEIFTADPKYDKFLMQITVGLIETTFNDSIAIDSFFTGITTTLEAFPEEMLSKWKQDKSAVQQALIDSLVKKLVTLRLRNEITEGDIDQVDSFMTAYPDLIDLLHATVNPFELFKLVCAHLSQSPHPSFVKCIMHLSKDISAQEVILLVSFFQEARHTHSLDLFNFQPYPSRSHCFNLMKLAPLEFEAYLRAIEQDPVAASRDVELSLTSENPYESELNYETNSIFEEITNQSLPITLERILLSQLTELSSELKACSQYSRILLQEQLLEGHFSLKWLAMALESLRRTTGLVLTAKEIMLLFLSWEDEGNVLFVLNEPNVALMVVLALCESVRVKETNARMITWDNSEIKSLESFFNFIHKANGFNSQENLELTDTVTIIHLQEGLADKLIKHSTRSRRVIALATQQSVSKSEITFLKEKIGVNTFYTNTLTLATNEGYNAHGLALLFHSEAKRIKKIIFSLASQLEQPLISDLASQLDILWQNVIAGIDFNHADLTQTIDRYISEIQSGWQMSMGALPDNITPSQKEIITQALVNLRVSDNKSGIKIDESLYYKRLIEARLEHCEREFNLHFSGDFSNRVHQFTVWFTQTIRFLQDPCNYNRKNLSLLYHQAKLLVNLGNEIFSYTKKHNDLNRTKLKCKTIRSRYLEQLGFHPGSLPEKSTVSFHRVFTERPFLLTIDAIKNSFKSFEKEKKWWQFLNFDRHTHSLCQALNKTPQNANVEGQKEAIRLILTEEKAHLEKRWFKFPREKTLLSMIEEAIIDLDETSQVYQNWRFAQEDPKLEPVNFAFAPRKRVAPQSDSSALKNVINFFKHHTVKELPNERELLNTIEALRKYIREPETWVKSEPPPCIAEKVKEYQALMRELNKLNERLTLLQTLKWESLSQSHVFYEHFKPIFLIRDARCELAPEKIKLRIEELKTLHLKELKAEASYIGDEAMKALESTSNSLLSSLTNSGAQLKAQRELLNKIHQQNDSIETTERLLHQASQEISEEINSEIEGLFEERRQDYLSEIEGVVQKYSFQKSELEKEIVQFALKIIQDKEDLLERATEEVRKVLRK